MNHKIVGYEQSKKYEAKYIWLMIAVAYSPYFLNDFVYIYLSSTGPVWRVVIADYINRMIGIGIILLFPLLREAADFKNSFKVRYGEWSDFFWLVLGFAMLTNLIERLLEINVLTPLMQAYPELFLFGFPRLEPSLLRTIDLTFGMLLVAISEELLNAKVTVSLLEKMGFSYINVVIISSTLFGLMHWSGGPGKILYTFILGAISICIYLRWRSLPLVIALHFIMDFRIFY